MTKKKTPTLEELNEEILKSQQQLRYYSDQEKILSRKLIPQLTRKERTNRLCTRAGMLESFLEKPELLTNEQVMDLLMIAFRQEPVRAALREMLEKIESETS